MDESHECRPLRSEIVLLNSMVEGGAMCAAFFMPALQRLQSVVVSCHDPVPTLRMVVSRPWRYRHRLAGLANDRLLDPCCALFCAVQSEDARLDIQSPRGRPCCRRFRGAWPTVTKSKDRCGCRYDNRDGNLHLHALGASHHALFCHRADRNWHDRGNDAT